MSTLSVDTIQGQTVAGTISFPAGYIVQCAVHKWTTEMNTTSGSFVDVNCSSFNFTPRYSTSLLLLQTHCFVRHDSGSSTGGALRFHWNGAIAHDPATYMTYDDGTGNRYRGLSVQASVTAGTTSAATIKLQSVRYNAGNFWVNWGGNYESAINVMEIAQ